MEATAIDRRIVITHANVPYSHLPNFEMPNMATLIAVRETTSKQHSPSVGERIEAVRIALGVNLTIMAELFYVNRAPLYAWVNGKSVMKPENFATLEYLEEVAKTWKSMPGNEDSMDLPVRYAFEEGTVIEYLRQRPMPAKLLERLLPVARKEWERSRKRGQTNLETVFGVLRPEPKD
jgi:hypothetical protein